jgi:hypothetical protein
VAESVGSQPVTEPEHHHVGVKELLRGYRLNGRIARASRVVIGVYTATIEAADEGLIGADEVAPPLLTAEPLLEPMGLAPDEPVEPLPDVISDPPGMDPLLEPTLQPVPDDEGRSLEEIIAAAERQEAAAASTEGQPGDEDELVSALPLTDGEETAEPADEDSLFRDAFGATLRPERNDD